MFWLGLVLIAIYSATVASVFFPVSLLQPSWVEKVAGSLRGGATVPLVGMALMLLSDHFQDRPEGDETIAMFRRWSCAAAIGFFLMIPLQTWAGWTLARQASNSESAQLDSLKNALVLIRSASTNEDLTQAITSIPGISPDLRIPARQPFDTLKASLINQFKPQVAARERQVRVLQQQRWQQGIINWIKDGIVSFFAGIGFAAVGRTGPDRPALLEVLLDRRLRHQRRLDPYAEELMALADDSADTTNAAPESDQR